jgi:hypothetical protein
MSSEKMKAQEQQEFPATQQTQEKNSFSDHALEKMMDLFHNHDHEVGSQLKNAYPQQYAEYQATDCITYVLNVITHAFRQLGDDQSAERAWQLGAHGTELARYLVEEHGWEACYVNPDAKHPVDDDDEHTYTSILASRDKKYYKIPLKYIIQNYRVTPDHVFESLTLNKNVPLTEHNETDIASLEQVAFGFGVSRGGKHTWLYSKGKVYEVHWNEIGDSLYEAKPLREFPWLSNMIAMPAGLADCLASSARIK